MPILGQGTYKLGEDPKKEKSEIEAIQFGVDCGLTHIDTAEMYGEGGSESVVGKAIAKRRDEVYLVSKVLPENASRKGTIRACEQSLKRLGVEFLDLYLLHWRGSHPLKDTLAAFQELKRNKLIRDFGVSNFDTGDMEEALQIPGGDEIVTNQVLYNLKYRGIEVDLLPWCHEREIVITSYSPIDHTAARAQALFENTVLIEVAARMNATPAQIALAWVLRSDNIVAIPKAAQRKHIEENSRCVEIRLSEADIKALDSAFPAPKRKVPLETL